MNLFDGKPPGRLDFIDAFFHAMPYDNGSVVGMAVI